MSRGWGTIFVSEVHQHCQPFSSRDLSPFNDRGLLPFSGNGLLPISRRGLLHNTFLLLGWEPMCLWTPRACNTYQMTFKKYCICVCGSQGSGNWSCNLVLGAEEDYQTKFPAMVQNLTNIATYRLNCPRGRFNENATLNIEDVRWKPLCLIKESHCNPKSKISQFSQENSKRSKKYIQNNDRTPVYGDA